MIEQMTLREVQESRARQITDAAMRDFRSRHGTQEVSDSAIGRASAADAGLTGCDLEITAGRKWATPFRTSWTFKHFVNGKKVTQKVFIDAIPV